MKLKPNPIKYLEKQARQSQEPQKFWHIAMLMFVHLNLGTGIFVSVL
jgi:hypothetical protein